MKMGTKREVAGSALIDAMIAIVVFSIGILGVVRLQSAAIGFSTDAKYRADAALLADALIGEMWSADPSTLAAQFTGSSGAGGARYAAWNTRVTQIPGGAGKVAFLTDGSVEVSVEWKAPGDQSGSVHRYVASTSIQR